MATILVRNSRDRRRYIGRRGWVIGARRARVFASTHAAMVFSHEHGFEDAEVLVRFGEPRVADVAISLPTEVAPGASSTEEWMELVHATA